MTTKNLFIKSLSRHPQTNASDEIYFTHGVNVIVGKPNTGKTQWMRMLNYVMGSDKKPIEAFNSHLAEKYDSVQAVISIAGLDYTLERRWKEDGKQGTVFVNGAPVKADDLSPYLLKLLDIPVLNYPSGNPFSPRTWPHLSLRSLYRHIYRNQKSWADIAAQQPDGEQLACILLFLGLAEHLYSSELGAWVKLEREIDAIKANRDQFLKMLNQVSQELISETYADVGVSGESIRQTLSALQEEAEQLEVRREQVVRAAASEVVEEEAPNEIDRLSEEWEALQEERARLLTSEREARERLDELEDYYAKVEEELDKLERAKSAGLVLAGLKVTHCPVCHLPVKPKPTQEGPCYLCHQEEEISPTELETSKQRLEFEFEQLQAEEAEAKQLIAAVKEELKSLRFDLRRVDEGLVVIDRRLKPVRRKVAAILPAEVSILDEERGRLVERRRQLERVEEALATREKLTADIEAMEKRAEELETKVKFQKAALDFKGAAASLADHMNTYLYSLHQTEVASWTQGKVEVQLRDRYFNITVGGDTWDNKLGGTLTLYFLAAYNYGLLSLSNHERYHYPGLTILDFPPSLEDGTVVTDVENFILEPFVTLASQARYQDVQVIVTGRSFAGLEGANRIEFTKVWT